MEGVKELQRKIKADGLKIVVVTGSGQKSLLDELCIEFEGLIVPELIVCSYDVKHGKPHPEPYLIGMQKAGVEPWEAIVVENAPLGVRSAVAANIFTIGVNTGPLPNSMLTNEGASLVFNKMQDLADSWEEINKR
jgi:beta-phosphoglucomutase-like phosphatase (HAD superfamily)